MMVSANKVLFFSGALLITAGLYLLWTGDPSSIQYDIWDELVGAGALVVTAGLIKWVWGLK